MKKLDNWRRIKIAYLTVNDPLDKRSWSGTTYYIGQTLQKNVGDVSFLGPVELPRSLDKIFRGVAKLTRILFKKEYIPKYSLLLSWYSSWALKKKMKGQQFDCVCAPAASTELSYFKTDLPVVYISDTTFKLISTYYKQSFGNMSSFSKWEANHIEKRALRKSSLAIYSSRWAAKSAVKDYKISEGKLFVMPLGANMDIVPGCDVIFKKEQNETLVLLYLAVEWERKGGDIAFEALKSLHDKYKIRAKLIVCGCRPPADVHHPYMEVVPFLNKNIPEDHKKFVELLSVANFLILPTRADCSLLVACEANAYGVPAITTDTGGVPDIVVDGENGYCLPYEARGCDYGELIKTLFSDKEKYHQLILSSRKRFENNLNWDKWADNFMKQYQKCILSNSQVA